jgi:hypothetical protein
MGVTYNVAATLKSELALMALSDTRVQSLKEGLKPDGAATLKTYGVTGEKGIYIEVTQQKR